jgi:membrane protease YdiL (CAAX protease family)
MKGNLSHKKPITKVLILFSIVLLSLVLFSIFAIPFTLFSPIIENKALSLRIILLLQSFCIFIVPAIIAQHLFWKEKTTFLFTRAELDIRLFILAPLLIFACSPIISTIMNWNQSLHLPEFMQSIEHWMKASEEEANSTLMQLFENNNNFDIIGNFITLGLAAAICEELFFRGILQRIFKEWTSNNHAAVWITAIIFSAIHLQFFGFFPRLLLGTLLGYLFVWSKNIWVPIFAHFCNNSLVVITEAINEKSTLNESEVYTWPWLLGSLLLTGFIIYGFLELSKQLQLKVFSSEHKTIT